MLFTYCINPDSARPILLIDRHIGIDKEDGIGVIGEQFAAELLTLDEMGKKDCEIRINSVGGSVKDGMTIYSAMLKTKMKVDTFNMGIAASISAVLFMAGRNRVMADYSATMIHNPYDPSDPDAKADTSLEVFRNSIISMISSRTDGKLSCEEVEEMMNKTQWFFADPKSAENPEGVLPALDYGMCTSIEYSHELNKPRISTSNVSNAWKVSLNYVNQSKDVTPMKKVYAKLNITENSTEDVIVNAIDAIKNKAEQLEDSIENKENGFKKKMKDMEDSVTDAQKKCKDAEDALAAFKKTAEDEKEKADAKAKVDLEAKAKLLVAAGVKAGKIKNDAKAIAAFEKQAVENYDGTVEVLNAISVNKTGVDLNKIENKAGEEGAPIEGETNAAFRMAQINNRLKKQRS